MTGNGYPYKQWRKLDWHPADPKWRANRLMFLEEWFYQDFEDCLNKDIIREINVLRNSPGVHRLTRMAQLDADFLMEDGKWKGKFKDNYYKLGGE